MLVFQSESYKSSQNEIYLIIRIFRVAGEVEPIRLIASKLLTESKQVLHLSFILHSIHKHY